MQNSKTKLFSLILSLIMLALVFVPFNPQVVGLHTHEVITSRLLYSFFHASLLHWLVNVWCFLSCVFLANVPFRKILLAYIIAASAPALSTVPTIGFSGVCFALLGMVMWQVPQKLRYNTIIGISIALSILLFPKAVNNILHSYCYLLGVLSAFPFLSKKKTSNSKPPYTP